MDAIVHVGLIKTGTTAIQDHLAGVSDDILAAGVLYPDLGTERQHFGLVPAVMEEPEQFIKSRVRGYDRAQAKAWGHHQVERLETLLQSSSARLCVLSSEFFGELRTEDLDRLVRLCDRLFRRVDVIAYVRKPEGLYLSVLKELIQSGNGSREALPLPWEFRSRNFGRVDRLLKAFGRERLHVVPYHEVVGKNGSVVSDFCLRLGIAVPEEEPQSNVSPPGAVLVTMLRLDRFVPKWIDHNRQSRQWEFLRRRLGQVVRHNRSIRAFERLQISDPAWLAAMVRNHAREGDWLNRTFFEGRAVFSVEDPVATPDPSAFSRGDFDAWLASYGDLKSTTTILMGLLRYEVTLWSGLGLSWIGRRTRIRTRIRSAVALLVGTRKR